jgi:hypothetical protein
MLKKVLAFTTMTVMIGGPAYATTTIASLGEAPLVGQLRSTNQLRAAVFKKDRLISRAARMVGLTADQKEEFDEDIATNENIRWVTIPRHLDAMAWQTDGKVHVIKDVMIPPHTNGWAVYLKGGTVAYMPAKCGNLSVLHTPQRRVAVLPAVHPAPPPPEEAPPAPAAPPPVAAPPPPITYATPTPLSAIPPPVVHHISPFDFLGALLVPLFIPGGGGSSSSPSSAPGPGIIGAPVGGMPGGCTCP